jgi:hypothetical protein
MIYYVAAHALRKEVFLGGTRFLLHDVGIAVLHTRASAGRLSVMRLIHSIWVA